MRFDHLKASVTKSFWRPSRAQGCLQAVSATLLASVFVLSSSASIHDARVSGRDSAWNFAMPPVAGSPSAAIQPERETVTAIALAPPSATLVLVGDATPEEPESAKVVEPESAKLAEPERAKPVEPESAKPSEPESPAVRRPVRRVDAVDGYLWSVYQRTGT